jgi:EAL domain-containing protein (putative c-di-GMP-specific phosphodiesterase class I)
MENRIGGCNMQRQEWPAIIGAAMFALLASGSGIFILAVGEVDAAVIAGAIFLLSIGQAATLFVQWMRNTNFDEGLSEHTRKLRKLTTELATFSDRIAWLQKQIAEPPVSPLNDLMKEVRSLRDKLETVAQDIARNRPPLEEPDPMTERATPANADDKERLDFLLEPVVELATGTTAHYRVRVSMVSQLGGEVAYEEMMRKADAGGMRAALDIHVTKLALPVLHRLRRKHPAMCLLLPLGLATLRAEAEITRLIQVLEGEQDMAQGIVFDIAHGDLAALDAAGIEGLAKLGRMGTKMVLSKISISGLDLAALRQLGVRFLDIDAKALNARLETGPAWVEFAQFARAMQFQMIGGSIATPDQAETASLIARFGYGPYFAPPRRVRADAGQTARASDMQAA